MAQGGVAAMAATIVFATSLAIGNAEEWFAMPIHSIRARACKRSGATAVLDNIAALPPAHAVHVTLADGGVGNALNPITAALAYAVFSNRSLIVDVKSGSRLGPYFEPSTLAAAWGGFRNSSGWLTASQTRSSADCKESNRLNEWICVQSNQRADIVHVKGGAAHVDSDRALTDAWKAHRAAKRDTALGLEELTLPGLLDCARASLFRPSRVVREAAAPHLRDFSSAVVVGVHFRSSDKEMATFQGLHQEMDSMVRRHQDAVNQKPLMPKQSKSSDGVTKAWQGKRLGTHLEPKESRGHFNMKYEHGRSWRSHGQALPQKTVAAAHDELPPAAGPGPPQVEHGRALGVLMGNRAKCWHRYDQLPHCLVNATVALQALLAPRGSVSQRSGQRDQRLRLFLSGDSEGILVNASRPFADSDTLIRTEGRPINTFRGVNRSEEAARAAYELGKLKAVLDMFLLSVTDVLFTNCPIMTRGGSTFVDIIRGLRLETDMRMHQELSLQGMCKQSAMGPTSSWTSPCEGVISLGGNIPLIGGKGTCNQP